MINLLRFSLGATLLLFAQITFAQLQNTNLQLRSTMDFPDQTLANVCGYWQNGQEYALLGGSLGLIIVDITNPDAPQQIVQIPGPNNLWKEIKVYEHYAYITTEGGGGLQIVDLSDLPSPNLNYYSYEGDGAIAGDLDEIHALHIDVTKGFLYTFGGDLASGGAKMFDLKLNPYTPKYIASFEQLGYIHDGYVDNDTLYACHINGGFMSVVDMANKSNPIVLGTVETPAKFTHNAWITDDRKHVLTTDEKAPSFLTSYDVSDPSDIRELDRLSPNNGNGTYVHNTHILNDYAVTSWYTSGVLIVDAHRPQNLVTVAQFDTYAGNQLDFVGCWGVFPYFPSGNIIASDIEPGQMTVLTPTYKRACYLEGKITNGCNGIPMLGATIRINGGTAPQKIVTTPANGLYRTGLVTPGNFTVTISAPGFISQTVPITLETGIVTELNLTLEAGPIFESNGIVTELGTNIPIANASVALNSSLVSFNVTTNALGQFSLGCMPVANYTAVGGKWGYLVGETSVNQSGITELKLTPGYYDDFATDLGWTSSSAASSGDWELGEPDGTYAQFTEVGPENDASVDNNDQCYVTGNGGGDIGTDDVDNGTVTLISPVMKLAAFPDAVLSFHYWFYNGGGMGTPNDRLQVNLLNGNQSIPLVTITESQSEWRYSGEIHLNDFLPILSDNLRVQFIARDDNPGHLVEAAVDVFSVVPEIITSTANLEDNAFLMVSPNPSSSQFAIEYAWESASENPILEVYNMVGQLVLSQTMASKTGVFSCGNNWTTGVYFAKLRSEGRSSETFKMIKQ
jgi:choice-of-anchor B domain-containing protein